LLFAGFVFSVEFTAIKGFLPEFIIVMIFAIHRRVHHFVQFCFVFLEVLDAGKTIDKPLKQIEAVLGYRTPVFAFSFRQDVLTLVE
jgi:hypothetical protein